MAEAKLLLPYETAEKAKNGKQEYCSDVYAMLCTDSEAAALSLVFSIIIIYYLLIFK